MASDQSSGSEWLLVSGSRRARHMVFLIINSKAHLNHVSRLHGFLSDSLQDLFGLQFHKPLHLFLELFFN